MRHVSFWRELLDQFGCFSACFSFWVCMNITPASIVVGANGSGHTASWADWIENGRYVFLRRQTCIRSECVPLAWLLPSSVQSSCTRNGTWGTSQTSGRQIPLFLVELFFERQNLALAQSGALRSTCCHLSMARGSCNPCAMTFLVDEDPVLTKYNALTWYAANP